MNAGHIPEGTKWWLTLALLLVVLPSSGIAGWEGKTTLNEQLLVAADHGDVATVKSLLDKGADANASYSGLGGTVLMRAAYSGHLEVVRVLVDRGANVNAEDEDLGTVLMSAAQGGNFEIVKLLLEKGAAVNDKDWWGGTALMSAAGAKGDRPEVVKLLLDKGADINARTRDEGKTVLVERSIFNFTLVAE